MDNADKIFCLERISILERHRKQLAEEICVPTCKGAERECSKLRESYSALEKAFFDMAKLESKFLLELLEAEV